MNAYPKLQKWLKLNNGEYVDVILAGRIFGGRVQESPQRPEKFEVKNGVITIYFKGPERLRITKPEKIEIGDFNSLIINNAESATFGWYSYGEQEIPENWCQLTYFKSGSNVNEVHTGPSPMSFEVSTFLYDQNEFVKLL